MNRRQLLHLLGLGLLSSACSGPPQATHAARASTVADYPDFVIDIDWSGSPEGLAGTVKRFRHQELPSIIAKCRPKLITVNRFDVDGWQPQPLASFPLQTPSFNHLECPPVACGTARNIEEMFRKENLQRRAQAEQEYRDASLAVLQQLEQVQIVPPDNHETKHSDIVGLLERYAHTAGPTIGIALTDLADTRRMPLPKIEKPNGDVHLLILLLPARAKDSRLVWGAELTAAEQYKRQTEELRRAADWAKVAPAHRTGLEKLLPAFEQRQLSRQV